MKKYLVILIVAVVGFTHLSEGVAQPLPEAFAGGEITAKYVGNGTETCGQPLPYQFTMRLFRDDPGPGGVAFPAPRSISVFKVDPSGLLFTADKVTGGDILLNDYTAISTIPTPCIIASTTVTDGGVFKNSVPVLLDANSAYVVIYGNENEVALTGISNFTQGLEFNSPNNNNLKSGFTFTLSSIIRTTACAVVTTNDDDLPVNEFVEVDYGNNSMPQWITNGSFEIVQSLCEDKSYEFNLNQYIFDSDVTTYNFFDLITGALLRQETVTDELEIDVVSVRTGFPGGAYPYVNGLSGAEPFPTSSADPYTWDPATGVLRFTPVLPTGQTYYTAALNVRITEYRKGYRLEPLGGAGGTDFRRIPERRRLSTIDRQIRFVIGDVSRCNKNLPVLSSQSGKRNPTNDAWEFGCATKQLTFTMDKPMLLNTVSTKVPYDLRIVRGINPSAPQSADSEPIDKIIIDPADVDVLGQFNKFTVVMKEGLGPGKYVLFPKNGDDGNTWGNLCGFFMEEGRDSVVFEINTNYEGYVFKEDDDPIALGSQKVFCYPSDEEGFFIDALVGQDEDIIEQADQFFFSYVGPFDPNAPAQFTVTQTRLGKGSIYDVFPTITVPNNYLFPDVPLITPTAGFWRIGIGLRYTHPFEGNTVVNRCFGQSFTQVQFKEHPNVTALDIDLCVDEDFPVIKDLIDKDFRKYNPIGPYAPTNYSWKHRLLKEDRKTPATPWTPVGGQSDPNKVISQGGRPVESLILQGAAAFGVGRVNQIEVKVTFQNNCVSENIITVIKQVVEVDIQEVPLKIMESTKDSVICEGQEFRMSNSKGDLYYRPENMSRQWYFNGQMIPNATTDVLPKAEMIKNGEGWYKLVVTKTTAGSVCFGADSVFIKIVDNLVPTEPVCAIVTFKDGAINQRFYWPVVPGADNYQVRPVDGDENPLDNDGNRIPEAVWYEPNDDFGIHHWVKGQEVRLYVRAVNNEVEEPAPCKYGQATLAESCEVLVKPVNIFTPNGDGINDFLRFDLLEVFIGNKLTVFNRWGKEVFQSSNYQNNWDGGDLKDGTYFYILDIDDPSGVQDIFKGTFTIVR